jgi:hypothetical protein
MISLLGGEKSETLLPIASVLVWNQTGLNHGQRFYQSEQF